MKEAIEGLFTSVSDGKAAVASAITDKGVPTAQDADFSTLADNIRKITSGAETSDATATPGDILSPKTAYTAAGKVEGLIPSLAAQTILPGTADKTIASGQYLRGTQTIRGDTNLTSGNIKKGVTLFGVTGALESSFRQPSPSRRISVRWSQLKTGIQRCPPCPRPGRWSWSFPLRVRGRSPPSGAWPSTIP